MTRSIAILGALLLTSETLYLGLARHDAISGAASVGQFLGWLTALFVCYGAACWHVARKRDRAVSSPVGRRDRRRALILITLGAVTFRLTMAGAGLSGDRSVSDQIDAARADLTGDRLGFDRYLVYDDDIWRYLWDGHVLAHGENPYRFAPDDRAVDRFADAERSTLVDGLPVWPDIRDNINHPTIPTIYPPLAQAVFVFAHALAPGSVLALKAVIIAADLVAVLFVALTLRALGRPPELSLLYAWNPLAIKVFAGSGHVDALLVAALAACAYFVARGARTSAGAVFGLAVLAKLSPLVILPLVARRVGWRGSVAAAAVVIGGYLPFAGAGGDLWQGLSAFSAHWEFNAGLYAVLSWIAQHVTTGGPAVVRVVAGVGFALATCWLALRDDGHRDTFAGAAALTIGALLLLSPVVMPWYVTWILPLAVIADQRTWLWFSALVCLAFLVMLDGHERAAPRWIEYGALAGIGLYEWRTRLAAYRATHAGLAQLPLVNVLRRSSV